MRKLFNLLLGASSANISMYKYFFKRLIGFVLSLCGLLILWPLMGIIAIAIRFDSKGRAIFKQKRLGKGQKEFTIYKFRTMVQHSDKTGGTVCSEGDPRITRIGSFLRKTSLDEIPQLWNILKGDMSIIGPRPILAKEFAQYRDTTEYARRYEVRPGLFCSVDVHYRATALRETQFMMDVEYIDKISFALDLRLFFDTLITVLKRKNIYSQ